jgi:hypothetical protein
LWNVNDVSSIYSHPLGYCNVIFVVQDEDLDDDAGGPINGMLASQHQDIHNSLLAEGLGDMDAYAGDNLVTPPCKVCTIPHCNIILRCTLCECS